MTQSDVFALNNSGLEPLLFAEVGVEPNGSRLTVLSLLARRGFDPWAEAARWVGLPKGAAIACLAGNIARMPLVPPALAEAHTTATRLIRLLPVNNTVAGAAARALPVTFPRMPRWLPMTLLYCALAIGLGASVMMAPRADTALTPSSLPAPHPPQGAPAD